MREIKLRAWDKENKKWSDDELYELGKEFGLMADDMEGVAIDANGYPIIFDECGRYAYPSIDRFEIMQFTGLKDKNGKEIYEFDRVGFKYTRGLQDVIELTGLFLWHEDELRYEIEITGDDNYITLSYVENGIMFDFEVIGNIYENSGTRKAPENSRFKGTKNDSSI